MLISRACVWTLLGCVTIACAGSGGEAASPIAAEPASAAPELTPASSERGDETAPAAAAAPAPDAPSKELDTPVEEGAATAASDTESSARNVKYIVNPEGMRVEIEGVSLVPKVETVQKGGGWGVKLKVEVRAKDGKTHSILAPEGKEIAFAGKLQRKDQSEPELFSDRREGDRELVLDPKKPLTLSRTWPGPSEPKPLAMGDEVEIMVGIWGLGEDAGSRRPLKKFCKITLKLDKPKPRALVKPPDGVSR
jgi:hypothetical protein